MLHEVIDVCIQHLHVLKNDYVDLKETVMFVIGW